MWKPPLRADNFRTLDSNAASTKRLIEGMIGMRHPIPTPLARDGMRFETSYCSDLAERISAQAKQGRYVRLKPETATIVAYALWTVAEGPLTEWKIGDSFTFTVQDWTSNPPEVLAYTRNVNLSNGAWEKYAPLYPERHIVARWGMFTTRGKKYEQG